MQKNRKSRISSRHIAKTYFIFELCERRFNFLRGLSNNDGNGLVQLLLAAILLAKSQKLESPTVQLTA